MRRFLLTTLPIASLALATLVPLGCAHAQMISSREGIALENQILELKQQIQAMQSSSGGSALAQPSPAPDNGSSATNPLLPNMLQQIQTLTDQVQNLRGRVDTLEHEVATQHDELKQEIGNLKFQLSQTGAAAPGAPPTAAAPPPAAPAAARPARVDASITAARRALAAGDYATAAADSRAVIAKQGKGAGKGAAELTLARALAGQGDHQSAAIAYDDAYNAARTGPYAPDALLGLANSLTAIHQSQEACDTLDSLASQFSSPSASLAARLRLARARAHCN
ncbi:tetratricopeptide repeat protein [Acidiphilium sp.]|uniref:tetratricopeptide repeat protein n=1 Tax=Acidiphilium sp. TaxID=527 RepID=UPI003CFE543E